MTELFQPSATALAELLRKGEASSEEITRAHLDRIAAVDGVVRAFVTVLADEAIAAARRADEERRRGAVRGPLHGLPVTIKESIDMAGHASTLGVPRRKDTRSASDAPVVQLVREAGGVILGRTNVAQLLLFHESRNPVFGQTVNPWNTGRSPGGSSGGESAAIAAGLSPLGVGTDIGGSIRVPAHFCGIAGLKPTLDRWPNLGLNTAIAGQEAIRAQVGPMARTARDVALFFGALDPRRMTALDPRVPPLAFDDPAAIDVSKLRVGYFVDDGLVPSSRAVSRAVVRAARALRARGATVVDFTPPDLDDAAYSYLAALSADGGRTAWAYLGDAEVDPALTVLRKAASLPGPVRRAAARVARAAGENRLARLLEAMGEKTVAELYRLVAHLRAYRANLLAAMEAAQIDVILGPPHATPAMQHTMSKDFTLAGSPSMLWNLVQFPAGVVATTRVRPGEAERPDRRDRLEKRAASVDEGSAGLPIGVQLAARPWQDHVVLAAMIALEDELAGDEERPVTPILSI